MQLIPELRTDPLALTVNYATPSSHGQLGLLVFVDNLGEKAKNARISLEEGGVRLVRGVPLATA